jgi:hypothetical protein
MILVTMIFAFLCLTFFSWILFEISLRASRWIDQTVSVSVKTMRSEKDFAIKTLKEDLHNEIKRSTEILDKLVPIVRVLRLRVKQLGGWRELLGDKELDDLPSI